MSAPVSTAPVRGAFVDGAWLEGPESETFAVIEPATGRELGRVASSGPAEVDAAVESAGRRFAEDWRRRSPRERGGLLREVAARIRDNLDELAELEAREVGKPHRDAQRFDLSFCHAGFDYFAGLARHAPR